MKWLGILFEKLKDKRTSGSMQYGFILKTLMRCMSCFEVIFCFLEMIFSHSDIFLTPDASAPKTVDILNQTI